MPDPISMRIRRAVDSFAHASAARTLHFIIKDLFSPVTEQISEYPGTVAGDYACDARATETLVCPKSVTPVIFQTWKSRTEIPANFRHWRNSFVALNPDWLVLLWDDDDNLAFIKEKFPWFMPYYEAYPREIFRADIVRFFFLFEFGGFYADMDTECLKPVAESVSGADIVLCRMGKNADFPHSIPNAIMASKPAQVFWLFAITKAIEAFENCEDWRERDAKGPESLTGPELLKRCVDEYSKLSSNEVNEIVSSVRSELTPEQNSRVQYGEIRILPPNDWYPLDWTNLLHKQICNRLRKKKEALPRDTVIRLFPTSTAITYWNHTW